MTGCRFDNVVVIGCGKISATVLKYVVMLRDKYGFALSFIQHESQEFTAIRKICEANEVPLYSIPEKKHMTEKLLSFQGNTLIISAGNYYLFPRILLEKDNVEVINFHNALLPKYPGRNAPSWAIYYEERESGATWHKVTEAVDSGEIIWQKACEITLDMKAYELTAKIMELAQEGIEAFLEPMLQGEVCTVKQEADPNRVMYYAKDIPSDGVVNVTDDGAYIYRTLRSVDYGKMGPFPPTIMKLPGEKRVEVLRYKKVAKEAYNIEETANNEIAVPLDEETLLWIRYKEN